MRKLFAISALVLAAGLHAGAAEAEGRSYFLMADGRYYDPASGFTAESPAQLDKLLGSAASINETPVVPEAPFVGNAVPSASPSLISAIARAKQLLQEQIVSANQEKPRIVTSYDVWVDVTLAVWNARTDEIRTVKVKKNGFGLKMDPSAPDDLAIAVKKNNGVNTHFALDSGDLAVVAVRYPIFKNVSVSKRKPKYELQDVVYVPYSDAIHRAELVDFGRQTLRSEVAAAYAELDNLGVRSRAFPDKRVTEVVDPRLVEAIAVIEHVGLGALSGENADKAMESFYATVGGNQREAYVYSRSTAGALGMVQFIPSTYKLMAKRKELGLIQDFTAGMSDPVNAIKAQIAYLDAILASMPLGVKDLYSVDPLRVDEYLAASYNTGETRVKRAIARWGDTWSEPHDAEIAAAAKKFGRRSAQANLMKRATLVSETVMYVKKLRQALKLLSPPPPSET